MTPVIMAVDDDPLILELIDLYLPAYGVKTVKSGAAALTALDFVRPNLVLLDIQMPEMDGVETLKRIRERLTKQDCAVMMLTAKSDADTVRRVSDAGANAYLLKPFTRNELVSRVNRLLGVADHGALEAHAAQ